MNGTGVAAGYVTTAVPLAAGVTALCLACQATTADVVWPGQGRFTLRRCRRCRLTFTVPHLTSDEMRSFYDARYYGTTGRFSEITEWIVGWFRRRRAEVLCRLLPPGSVLDIGCGSGHMLQALRQRGWRVTGSELSERAARHARLLGLDVEVGAYSPDHWMPGSFDAVILWHALEHLPDPRAILRGLARLVRPGGIVAIAVPSFSNPTVIDAARD